MSSEARPSRACSTPYVRYQKLNDGRWKREWTGPLAGAGPRNGGKANTAGVHITSVGYNPAGREVDDATVTQALVCVESRQAALAPFPAGSNDLLAPIRDGLITAEHVHAELGELVAGSRPGRTSPDQITLYKSVGVAVQDAAATALVVASAREQSIGEEITLQ
ncbi:hypothetical protein AB0A66_12945 [Streptomyces longwoodensis]|uniref:hypothetical protein n=1 Tax=Streptomyces longwoodensis TaxID=68231 RepID=UPI0033F851A7